MKAVVFPKPKNMRVDKAADRYEIFNKKQDNCVKVVMKP